MRDLIAKIISRPVTILLLLGAVVSIFLATDIDIRLDLLLTATTFVIPVLTIVLFKVFKLTKDLNVTDRKDRPKLFVIMGICFLISLYIAYVSKDSLILDIYLILNLTFFTGFLITLFWKISYHQIWSCMAVFSIIYIWQTPLSLFLLLLIPLIGWSRLELKRHTLSQVVGGTLLSIFWVLVVLTYL